MTSLTKPLHRLCNKTVSGKRIVFTLAPGSDHRDDLIGLRLIGERTQYVTTVADIYRMAALWHGQKEAMARRAARKSGTPWRKAKKEFLRANQIPTRTKPASTDGITNKAG